MDPVQCEIFVVDCEYTVRRIGRENWRLCAVEKIQGRPEYLHWDERSGVIVEIPISVCWGRDFTGKKNTNLYELEVGFHWGRSVC